MTGTHSLNYTYNGKFQTPVQTPVLWMVLCKPPPILVKPEEGNINVLIWIMTKESWPSFVERQKTQQLKKNWIEAQSGFNLKEVHCKKHKTGKLPKNFVLVFYRRLETILKKKIIFFEKIVVPQNTHPNMNTTRE